MEDVLNYLKECFRKEMEMARYCLESGSEDLLSYAYVPKMMKLAKMMDDIKSVMEVKNDIAA